MAVFLLFLAATLDGGGNWATVVSVGLAAAGSLIVDLVRRKHD